jgi:alkylhydroperoxidase/carboxymuconolactone decarboxylase family protein YurZ
MDTYYDPADLEQFGNMGEDAPELWDAFMAYYGKVFADGALTAREKALIAFAVAHAIQCLPTASTPTPGRCWSRASIRSR